MIWNIKNINFLHQPEYFLGSFDNPKMQARHEDELAKSLTALKLAITKESDPLKALNLLNPLDHIQFLLNNFEEFKKHGRLEEAVLSLYLKANRPFSSGGDASLWQKLFRDCDRTNLGKLGTPFPTSINKVYRGSVSGMKRSLTWTADKRLVDSFVVRWQDASLGGGEIYEVNISPADVLTYCEKTVNRRTEKIIILDPDFVENADIRTHQR